MTEQENGLLPARFYAEAARWQERREAGEAGFQVKLEAWLQSDPRNRQAFEEAEAVFGATRFLPRGAAGFDGKLMLAPLHQRRSTHLVLGGIAAVALAGFATMWAGSKGLLPQLVSPAEAATYETVVGEIRTYRLANASALTLDTDTKVKVRMSGSSGRIEISKGRFRVESVQGEVIFVVASGTAVATVKGQSFDADSSGGHLRIAAVKAPVELSDAEPDTGAPRQLAGGSRIDIGYPASAGTIPGSDIAWVSGMLALDGSRLDKAVETINRYNRTKIRLGGGVEGSRTISGAFRADEPEAFARAMSSLQGLKIDRSRAGVIVLLAP